MSIHFYKVGGCVRDAILGIKSNDIDYTVVLDEQFPTISDAFAYMSNHLALNGYQIFLETEEFLTIRAKKGKEAADFVLARKELGYIPGTRNPIVVQGTLEDDLIRRDFTFNALALDENGKLIDLFDGEYDLRNRVLRTPLPAMTTFADDPLRVLRAVRFAVKYDCTFTDDIMGAIQNPKLPELMSVVSLDRVRDELYKAMKVDSFRTLKLLANLPEALVKSWLRDGLWLMPTTKE
jgi:tRNA nucleotidyltransferase/poly(A) polymerase